MTEQHTPDEESLRLLNELENDEKSPREKLEEKAALLGVKFHGNTSNDTLQKRIDKAEAQIASADAGLESEPEAPTKEDAPVPETKAPDAACGKLPTITNISKNRRRICGVDIAVGESYTLTENDMEDDRLMAKITRALQLGVLESD